MEGRFMSLSDILSGLKYADPVSPEAEAYNRAVDDCILNIRQHQAEPPQDVHTALQRLLDNIKRERAGFSEGYEINKAVEEQAENAIAAIGDASTRKDEGSSATVAPAPAETVSPDSSGALAEEIKTVITVMMHEYFRDTPGLRDTTSWVNSFTSKLLDLHDRYARTKRESVDLEVARSKCNAKAGREE
jgi:hypothetical protein